MVQQESQTDAYRKKMRDSSKKTSKTPFHKVKGKYNKRYSNRNGNTHKEGDQKNSKKTQKLSNKDDCPLHGGRHKWGQCHQNQYGENFRPRRASSNSQAHPSNSSRSQRTAFHQGPPNQVQIYSNESRASSSYRQDNSDSRSYRSSAETNPRYPSGYPPSQDQQYNEQYSVKSYNYKNENVVDHLPEGSILIQSINDTTVDLYALCLFDSGSTNTLTLWFPGL